MNLVELLQVPVAEGCASEMMLLTVAQVRIKPRRVAEPGELWPGPPPVRLLPDPVHPERLFCVHAHSAHVLTASWLPLLASRLTDGAGGCSASPDQAAAVNVCEDDTG